MSLQIGENGKFHLFINIGRLILHIFRLIATPATQPLTLYIGRIPEDLPNDFLVKLLEVDALFFICNIMIYNCVAALWPNSEMESSGGCVNEGSEGGFSHIPSVVFTVVLIVP